MTPDVFTLFAGEITTPLTNSASEAITGLDGAQAVAITARFAYGSGGATLAAKVQTSLDDGATWLDVAFFAFTTATVTKYCNLDQRGAIDVTSYAALVADAAIDGLLGDRLRAVITSTSTYVNTTLDVRASVR